MKITRSLLLGSAAGLVAVTGAQAADLPVKAKPVEYVKICTLYGEGYYYIPGSDTCIKFGGYIRADYAWNATGTTAHYQNTAGVQDRTVSRLSTTARANLQIDTRTQTSYGTLRTLTSLHNANSVAAGNTITPARAFIQWAGFTIGRSASFQDTFNIGDSYTPTQWQTGNDTGANGINQIAYTWELGNGATLTVGADDPRRKTLANLSVVSTIKVGAEPTSSYAGWKYPDLHIDFKLNQAWGFWATSVVAHDVSAQYYTCTAASSLCGHPNDKMGWGVQTGAEFKMDFINPGDRFGFGARYAVGMSTQGGGQNLSSPALFGSGNNVALGFLTDGVFTNNASGTNPLKGTSSEIQLTTAFTVMAAYEHIWTPTVKTSLYGSYTGLMYNEQAKADWKAAVCTTGAAVQQGINNVGNCDPNWQFVAFGTRTQWAPAPGFAINVGITYVQIYTAFKGGNVNINGPVFARPSGTYNLKDQGIVVSAVRIQRNFNAGD